MENAEDTTLANLLGVVYECPYCETEFFIGRKEDYGLGHGYGLVLP